MYKHFLLLKELKDVRTNEKRLLSLLKEDNILDGGNYHKLTDIKCQHILQISTLEHVYLLIRLLSIYLNEDSARRQINNIEYRILFLKNFIIFILHSEDKYSRIELKELCFVLECLFDK